MHAADGDWLAAHADVVEAAIDVESATASARSHPWSCCPEMLPPVIVKELDPVHSMPPPLPPEVFPLIMVFVMLTTPVAPLPR